MATVTVTLDKGLTIGDSVHLEAELREPTAGDVLDAAQESEKLLPTPEGYRLVPSPTLTGINMLRRQIVRIGDHPGPLTLAEVRKLSPGDLQRLQTVAEQLEGAALEALEDRGRMDKTPE